SNALGLGLEGEYQPVSQGRRSSLAGVLVGDVAATVAQGADFGCQEYGLCGSRTGAIADVTAYGRRSKIVVGMGGQDDAADVFGDVGGGFDHAHQLLHVEQSPAVDDRLHGLLVRAGGT